MSITENIVLAITTLNKLFIQYREEKEVKNYTVLPYLLGQHKKTENILLSAYDVSTNKTKHGWKTFQIDKIEKAELVEEYFEPNTFGYNAQDSRMRKILCSVKLNQ